MPLLKFKFKIVLPAPFELTQQAQRVADDARAKKAEAARRAEAAEREAEERRRKAARQEALSGLRTLLQVWGRCGEV